MAVCSVGHFEKQGKMCQIKVRYEIVQSGIDNVDVNPVILWDHWDAMKAFIHGINCTDNNKKSLASYMQTYSKVERGRQLEGKDKNTENQFVIVL